MRKPTNKLLFIINRQQEISIYFELINKDLDFSTLPPLIKFIEEKCSKQNIVENALQIKKEPVKIEEKKLIKSIQNNNSAKDYKKKLMNQMINFIEYMIFIL